MSLGWRTVSPPRRRSHLSSSGCSRVVSSIISARGCRFIAIDASVTINRLWHTCPDTGATDEVAWMRGNGPRPCWVAIVCHCSQEHHQIDIIKVKRLLSRR